MADFSDLVKKAFYLGVGAVSYAGEQANEQLAGLQKRAQALADEMIQRGEMTTEEARQWLDSLSNQDSTTPPSSDAYSGEPQVIDVQIEDDDDSAETAPVSDLHRQVQELQDEFRRLQQD